MKIGCWLFYGLAGAGDECGAKSKDYGKAKYLWISDLRADDKVAT